MQLKPKPFVIIIAIAVALRVLFIARAPLWYDENFTLLLARMSFDQMLHATAGDVHPPLWYLIEWILFHIAPNLPVWFIRVPALVFSILSVTLFYEVCLQLKLSERVTFCAFVLMAVMPFQIWYAQEGRMYALLEFLVLLALLTGLNKRWALFTLTAIVMVYTQNYGMFYLAVIGMILIVRDLSVMVVLSESALAVLVAYFPWLMVIRSQMDSIEGRYWIMDSSVGSVLGAIYKQFWASSMMQQSVIQSYFVTFLVIILGVLALMRSKVESRYIVLAMAFGPVLIAWSASLIWQPLLLFRPLIGISPFLYIIAAYNLEPLTFNLQQKLYTACLVVPVMMFGIAGYYINIANMKGDGAVASLISTLDYVRANWQDGDVLFYTDDGPMVNLLPYAEDLPQYRMPECESKTSYAPVLGSLSVATRETFGIKVANLDDIQYKRAWVFAPRSPLHPVCYEEQIADIASGAPLILIDNNKFITSGVWLVER